MTKNKNGKIMQMALRDTQRLQRYQAKEWDRVYMKGHQKHSEDLDWAESSAKLLAKRLRKEKW